MSFNRNIPKISNNDVDFIPFQITNLKFAFIYFHLCSTFPVNQNLLHTLNCREDLIVSNTEKVENRNVRFLYPESEREWVREREIKREWERQRAKRKMAKTSRYYFYFVYYKMSKKRVLKKYKRNRNLLPYISCN